MFLPKPDGGDFVQVPAGNHIAVCYRLIDLGTQFVEWKGVKKTQRKVLISWELPNELMPDGEYAGQPFTIGRRYTWSMSDKANLRHDLESWRGKSFTDDDFEGPNRFNAKNIIGKPCMLSIVQETKEGGSTYSNIKSVAAMPKGMTAPAPVNKPVYFSLERDLFDGVVLESLSDKLKAIIKETPEYKELVEPTTQRQEFVGDPRNYDDEIPF
jgi:hypothetical protein